LFRPTWVQIQLNGNHVLTGAEAIAPALFIGFALVLWGLLFVEGLGAPAFGFRRSRARLITAILFWLFVSIPLFGFIPFSNLFFIGVSVENKLGPLVFVFEVALFLFAYVAICPIVGRTSNRVLRFLGLTLLWGAIYCCAFLYTGYWSGGI